MSKKIDSRQEFINPAIYDGQIQKPTEGELQNEYNYLLAEQLTQSLMRDNLITREEYDHIMEKNRRSFRPFLSKIIA